jgi:hypothetical protein
MHCKLRELHKRIEIFDNLHALKLKTQQKQRVIENNFKTETKTEISALIFVPTEERVSQQHFFLLKEIQLELTGQQPKSRLSP